MNEINVVNRVAIGDILRRAASRYPDKVAMIEGEQKVTFRQLNQDCNRFAHYLLARGLKKGDCVATICANSLDFAIAIYGIAKAGLTWVPINPGISIEETKYILTHAEAKWLVGDGGLIGDTWQSLREVCPSVIVIGAEKQSWDVPFASTLDGQPAEEPDVDIQDRDVAQIMYTSGTTGMPKGVMISHLSVYIASLGNIIEMGLQTEHIATAMMPLFHCAQHTFTTALLHIGATSVILKFDPEGLMKKIEEERITWVFGLPMMYRMIIHHPKRSEYDLSSLKFCLYAMAPMDRPSLERGIHELGADFALGTGQTEIYPATMIFKPEEQLRRSGSYWGVSSLINETAIMDDEGNLLPQGEVGEIVHRGPNVMIGYLKNEKATKESRLYDWHHTGDLGYFDEDGQMVFLDRKKDMIKTGGENIASILIEQALITHPKVANASVVGLPHEHWSEAVTAFVILKPGEAADEEEIIAHCKQHLGGFQVPKSAIFVEGFPMTTTGKIQKHVLRRQFQNHYVK